MNNAIARPQDLVTITAISVLALVACINAQGSLFWGVASSAYQVGYQPTLRNARQNVFHALSNLALLFYSLRGLLMQMAADQQSGTPSPIPQEGLQMAALQTLQMISMTNTLMTLTSCKPMASRISDFP